MNKIYDIVCAGFGPAAIALAGAIDDAIENNHLPKTTRKRILFLEAAENTVWQGGLLLSGTNINNSTLSDLATWRDPSSQFTFTNYLVEKGRLHDFGLWSGAASRIEWSDYISWAAEKLKTYVHYSEPVDHISANPNSEGKLLDVHTSTGIYTTRQVVVACGAEPFVPEVFVNMPQEKVRHAHSYLYFRKYIDELVGKSGRQLKIAIIGSGLTAAETALDMLSRYSHDKVHVFSIHRGLAFRQYDMSQFSNIIYTPPEIDRFHGLSAKARRTMMDKTWATNFSGVDVECAAAFWRFLYERRVQGINNFTLLDRYSISNSAIEKDAVRLLLNDVNAETCGPEIEADFVLLCTGYQESIPRRLLNPLINDVVVEKEFDGLFSIDREYRVKTSKNIQAPIYMCGHSEHSHGVSNGQSFSMMAVKTARIFDAISSFINSGDGIRIAPQSLEELV
ncbi:SidA/IucD/PvdA family monooxygenase [Variovorax sp. H27-G14]|uniref:SidA/IucD/PvdA family monooxygenase n=1 Tax=Variovorax sp. H27-G14 TaxID=3111914 RepID=UPI0038FC2EB9